MLGHVRGPAYAKGVIEALLRGDSGGGGGEDAPMARSVIRPVLATLYFPLLANGRHSNS